MDTKQKREGKEEAKTKLAKKEPMAEMSMELGMRLKQSAIANDLSMFEKLVGKKVIIKIANSGYAVVGTLAKNGNDFIELEDVVNLAFVNGYAKTLERIKKYEANPQLSRIHGLEYLDSTVMNKSEIGRMVAADSVKMEEDA